MGNIMKASMFSLENHSGLSKPIIYCCSQGDMEKEAISISVALAKELIKLSPSRRTIQLDKCFRQVISELPDGVVIKEIDAMFNPAYKLDILILLIMAYKKKPFSVIWPGTYIDGKLVYAEEGCSDYNTYNIKNYDVLCII